jgi:hypothetical protein
MPLFALGICRRQDALRLTDKSDAELAAVDWRGSGELACAAIEAPQAALPPMRHAAVIEAIHRRMCVLPMRLGTVLGGEAEIESFLQDRGREFLERLDQLEGASEMALRLTLPQPLRVFAGPDAASPPSLAYLERRRSHYRRVDAAEGLAGLTVRRLTGHLQGTYRKRRLLPAPPQLVRLALLVDRDRIAAFRAGLKAFAETCRQTQCTALGPWPPYSFV